jgi:hypothetical protein
LFLGSFPVLLAISYRCQCFFLPASRRTSQSSLIARSRPRVSVRLGVCRPGAARPVCISHHERQSSFQSVRFVSDFLQERAQVSVADSRCEPGARTHFFLLGFVFPWRGQSSGRRRWPLLHLIWVPALFPFLPPILIHSHGVI